MSVPSGSCSCCCKGGEKCKNHRAPYSPNWGAWKSPKTSALILEAAGQTKRPAQFALGSCPLQGAVRLAITARLRLRQIWGSISPSQGITLADPSEPC